MKIWLAITTFIVFHFHIKNDLSGLEFLNGTWKVEDKEHYEIWEIGENGELSGYTCNLLVGGSKDTVETIARKIRDNQISYETTVPNQNDRQNCSVYFKPENKILLLI